MLSSIEHGKPLHTIEQSVDILPHPVDCTPVGHTLLLLYIMNSGFYRLIIVFKKQVNTIIFDRATISIRHKVHIIPVTTNGLYILSQLHRFNTIDLKKQWTNNDHVEYIIHQCT